MPMQMWLRNALSDSGKSQAELSRHLTQALDRNVDKTAVNKMLAGTRRIKFDEIREICRFTGAAMPGADASKNPDASLTSLNAVRALTVTVIGWAETGSFKTLDALKSQAPEQQGAAVPFDPRFPNARQFILQQHGDGMAAANPPIPSGAFLRCVHAGDAARPLRDGQIVVVEARHPHAPDLVERSVRRVKAVGDSYELVAESPAHYEPLRLGPDVTITAFVTSVMTNLEIV